MSVVESSECSECGFHAPIPEFVNNGGKCPKCGFQNFSKSLASCSCPNCKCNTFSRKMKVRRVEFTTCNSCGHIVSESVIDDKP